MPSLRRLLSELRRLGANPAEVRLPGRVYDDLVDQARNAAEDDPEPEEE